jgi:hypothetical protein
MMRKLTYIIPALALVFFATCNNDFTDMEVGLNGRWIALNGTRIELNGMSFTRTSAYGDVDTGTYAAIAGSITFSRIGHTAETMEYTLNFPELTIGGVTYYHDSPNEPVDIVGKWIPYPGQEHAVTFYPGKRIKDENKKETYDIEGEFVVHLSSKGKYTISNRNLPGQSVMVTVPHYIHGTIIFYFINIMMPISLLELFDPSILTPPETQEDVENWWFTIDEVRKYFEEAASKATALDIQAQVFLYMRFFLSSNETMIYDYTVEYDAELSTTYESAEKIKNNKLTLRTEEGATYNYFKWDGTTGTN